MRIGDLARATGFTPRMLRYYEQQGLLRTRRTSDGTEDGMGDGMGDVHRRGHRRYDDGAVTTVSHIRALLGSGVLGSLVHELLPCV